MLQKLCVLVTCTQLCQSVQGQYLKLTTAFMSKPQLVVPVLTEGQHTHACLYSIFTTQFAKLWQDFKPVEGVSFQQSDSKHGLNLPSLLTCSVMLLILCQVCFVSTQHAIAVSHHQRSRHHSVCEWLATSSHTGVLYFWLTVPLRP